MAFPLIPIMMFAGAALSAMGTMRQGKAQADALKAQADINRKNAQLKLQLGTVAEGNTRRQGARFQGRQNARIAKSGVQFSGTALEVIRASAAENELRALTARFEGVSQAQSLLTQAAFNTSEASNTIKAARASAATQLLKGAASAYGGFNSPTAGAGASAATGSDFTFANNNGTSSIGNM